MNVPDAWKQPELAWVRKHCNRSYLDMCAFGLRHPNGELMQKFACLYFNTDCDLEAMCRKWYNPVPLTPCLEDERSTELTTIKLSVV